MSLGAYQQSEVASCWARLRNPSHKPQTCCELKLVLNIKLSHQFRQSGSWEALTASPKNKSQTFGISSSIKWNFSCEKVVSYTSINFYFIWQAGTAASSPFPLSNLLCDFWLSWELGLSHKSPLTSIVWLILECRGGDSRPLLDITVVVNPTMARSGLRFSSVSYILVRLRFMPPTMRVWRPPDDPMDFSDQSRNERMRGLSVAKQEAISPTAASTIERMMTSLI